MTTKPHRILYHYLFEDGSSKSIEILLDRETKALIEPARSSPPEWTRLGNSQCVVCPLDETTHDHCPVAVNIVSVVDMFKKEVSFDKCKVVCTMGGRTISKQVSMREALAPVFFIHSIACDCPITSLLKPIAPYHMPFEPTRSLLIRFSAFFLLGQYFKQKHARETEISFKDFDITCDAFKSVYKGILGRLKNLTEKDADSSAILLLHSVTETFAVELKEDLKSIEPLFNSWY